MMRSFLGLTLCMWLHVPLAMAADLDTPTTTRLHFAVMPKSIDNAFFAPVREGCEKRASYHQEQLGQSVSCEWVGPDEEDPSGEAQAALLRNITASHLDGTHLTHGVAMSVMQDASMVAPIREALDAGIAVLTFDSDSPSSDRQAYVGTDNRAFGQQLVKILQQLRPTGGQLAILSVPTPNLNERVEGIRQELARSAWSELPDSITYQKGSLDVAMAQLDTIIRNHPHVAAIVPTYGGPMKNRELWTSFVERHSNNNLTFVVADAQPQQVHLMERGYADGLVGQLPYQTGEQCIDTLMELVQQHGDNSQPTKKDDKKVYGTNLSFFLRIPLVLPELHVDLNYLGPLRILGYLLLATILLTNGALTWWVLRNRRHRVVAAAQPFFLLTIAMGVFILSMAIVPLGWDDEYIGNSQVLNAGCMATVWLVTIGFGVIFCALFSKLWRVDRLLTSSMRFSKETVTIRQVLWPLLLLSITNVVLLTAWTIVAPLHYTRQDHAGTDPWNRKISSYGSCQSSSNSDTSALPFLVPLILVNFTALVIANVQAFRTRHIKSVLSESRYIAITVASMTQAAMVGLPVLLLVDDEPQAHYVVQVLLIFCVCMAVLLLIFTPKVIATETAATLLDPRSSNLGASLSGSFRRRSRSSRRTTSLRQSSKAENNNFNGGNFNAGNSANHDTVAQIRAAAAASSSMAFSCPHSGFLEPPELEAARGTQDNNSHDTVAQIRAAAAASSRAFAMEAEEAMEDPEAGRGSEQVTG